MNQKTTAIVTGGAGFIGSHLVDTLLRKGHTVFAFDNLITGKEENLFEAKKHENFTFIKHDVTMELPVVGHIDYLYHLASPASVPDYQKYAEETAMVNSVGTRALLKVAKGMVLNFYLPRPARSMVTPRSIREVYAASAGLEADKLFGRNASG